MTQARTRPAGAMGLLSSQFLSAEAGLDGSSLFLPFFHGASTLEVYL